MEDSPATPDETAARRQRGLDGLIDIIARRIVADAVEEATAAKHGILGPPKPAPSKAKR